ncbi:DNA repair protein RecO [Bauldia sp.]|uniref:DNA repair protein RecO n=1 Tax=Bauldia sp. TaxID=2575872 RepID=UPI003BAAFFA1
MQWTDDGIIIGTRRYGETSLIVEVMTAAHGRHLGLVRGGRSRRHKPVLQPGNSVIATWRARLDAHLGTFTIEPTAQRAARLMDSPAGLYAIQVLGGLTRLLPERDPHPQIHDVLAAIIDWLDDPLAGGALVVRFELRMLEELGFGLDLDQCAATGTTDDLAYVSPKSGRAVSRSAAEPWRDKMLPLPAFLLAPGEAPPADDLIAAFRLTEFFLARHVYEPRGLTPPDERARLIALIGRQASAAQPKASAL